MIAEWLMFFRDLKNTTILFLILPEGKQFSRIKVGSRLFPELLFLAT
jgi:hypothetical protein